jgi:hypothetical protein
LSPACHSYSVTPSAVQCISCDRVVQSRGAPS